MDRSNREIPLSSNSTPTSRRGIFVSRLLRIELSAGLQVADGDLGMRPERL
jgi:hypothetical protein